MFNKSASVQSIQGCNFNHIFSAVRPVYVLTKRVHSKSKRVGESSRYYGFLRGSVQKRSGDRVFRYICPVDLFVLKIVIQGYRTWCRLRKWYSQWSTRVMMQCKLSNVLSLDEKKKSCDVWICKNKKENTYVIKVYQPYKRWGFFKFLFFITSLLKRTRPISSYLHPTNLVNKGFFYIYGFNFVESFFLWDTAGSPERAR